MSMTSVVKEKVLFRLEQDDGYPPVSIEGLWAQKVGDNFVVDNIPFYVYGIAPGDQIQAKMDSGQIWFDTLLRASGSSIFRIFVKKHHDIPALRSALLDLSCPSEVDEKMGLIAVEIPVGVNASPFLEFLVRGQQTGQFDFEEGVLRHAV